MAVVVVKSITKNANPSDKKRKVESIWGNTAVSFSSQPNTVYVSEQKAASIEANKAAAVTTTSTPPIKQAPVIEKSQTTIKTFVPRSSLTEKRIIGGRIIDSPLSVNVDKANNKITYTTVYPDKVTRLTVEGSKKQQYGDYDKKIYELDESGELRFKDKTSQWIYEHGGNPNQGMLALVDVAKYGVDKAWYGTFNFIQNKIDNNPKVKSFYDRNVKTLQDYPEINNLGTRLNQIASGTKPSDIFLTAAVSPFMQTTSQMQLSIDAQQSLAQKPKTYASTKAKVGDKGFDYRGYEVTEQGQYRSASTFKGSGVNQGSNSIQSSTSNTRINTNPNTIINNKYVGQAVKIGDAPLGTKYVSESYRYNAATVNYRNANTVKIVDQSAPMYMRLENTIRTNLGMQPKNLGIRDISTGVIFQSSPKQSIYLAQSSLEGGKITNVDISGTIKYGGSLFKESSTNIGTRNVNTLFTKTVTEQATSSVLKDVTGIANLQRTLINKQITKDIMSGIFQTGSTVTAAPLSQNQQQTTMKDYNLVVSKETVLIQRTKQTGKLDYPPITTPKLDQPSKSKGGQMMMFGQGSGSMYATTQPQMTYQITPTKEDMKITPIQQQTFNNNLVSTRSFINQPNRYGGAGLLPFSSGIPQSYGGGLGISTKSKRTPSFGAVALKFNFGISVPKMSPFMESTGLSERAYTGNINLPNLEVKYWKKKRYLM